MIKHLNTLPTMFSKFSAATTRFLQRLRSDQLLKWSLLFVGVWRIVLEIVNQIIAQLYAHGDNPFHQWANWDGGWYIYIQNEGYIHNTPVIDQENIAFFPAFPTIVGSVAQVLHIDPLFVGLAFNTILTVGIIYVLMKLAQLFAKQLHVSPKPVMLLSAAMLLAFPASFYFAAYYAEAMLIFCVLSAIYFALTNRLWLAVPFMVVATATKVMGVIAVIVVAVIVFEKWHKARGTLLQLTKSLAVVSIGISGLLAFMAYVWIRFGDPILFYTAQKSWGRNDGGFFAARLIKNYYLHIFDPSYFGGNFGYTLNIFLMILPFVVISAAIYAWRRYTMYWPLVLGFLALALPLSTGIMDSLNRYSMMAAALLPFAALWLLQQKRALVWGAFIVSIALGLLFASVFLAGKLFVG